MKIVVMYALIVGLQFLAALSGTASATVSGRVCL